MKTFLVSWRRPGYRRQVEIEAQTVRGAIDRAAIDYDPRSGEWTHVVAQEVKS